jgi:hypothetical protein
MRVRHGIEWPTRAARITLSPPLLQSSPPRTPLGKRQTTRLSSPTSPIITCHPSLVTMRATATTTPRVLNVSHVLRALGLSGLTKESGTVTSISALGSRHTRVAILVALRKNRPGFKTRRQHRQTALAPATARTTDRLVHTATATLRSELVFRTHLCWRCPVSSAMESTSVACLTKRRIS